MMKESERAMEVTVSCSGSGVRQSARDVQVSCGR